MAERNENYTPFQPRTAAVNRRQARRNHSRGPHAAVERPPTNRARNNLLQQALGNGSTTRVGAPTSQPMAPFVPPNSITSARQSSLLGTHTRFMSPNNFMSRGNHVNNMGNSNSQFMVPLASSVHTLESSAPSYGGVLPLGLPRNPPAMGTLNMPGGHAHAHAHASHFHSGEGSSSSPNVGLQGSTNIGLPNSVAITSHNQLNNVPAHSHNLNPRLTALINNSPFFKEYNIDINTVLNNGQHDHHVCVGRPTPAASLGPHNPNQPAVAAEPSNPNAHFKRVSLEKALKRPLYEVDGIEEVTDTSAKVPMMSIPNQFFEGGTAEILKPPVELDLFKNNSNEPPPAANEMIEAEENEQEDLDLTLTL